MKFGSVPIKKINKMSRYLFQCGYCGSLLFKSNNPAVSLMDIEIKCTNRNCGKIIKNFDEIIVNREKEADGKVLRTLDNVA